MRICFVSAEVTGVRGGGIGTYVAEAAKALTAHGHEVWLLIAAPDPVEMTKLDDLEGFHRVVPVARSADPYFHLRENYAHAQQIHDTLVSLGETFDYIEFADYLAEGFVSIREHVLFGSYEPAIVGLTLHSPTWECLAFDKQAHRADVGIRQICNLEEEAIRTAPFLNCPSEALRDQVLSRLGLEREVAIIRYPMTLPWTTPPRPPAPRESLQKLTFLYYGRIEPRKGIDELVAAFATMPDLELELIGGDVPYSPFGGSYRDHVRLTAPRNVTFRSPLPRELLMQRVQDADVCIFPSLFENYPNTCIEAMLAARVVIGSKHGGMAEMIEHGVSGFLVDGRSPEDIVRVIQEDLREALPRLDAIGSAAAQRMRELTEPKRYVEALVARIEAARDSRPVRPASRTDRKVTVVVPFFNDAETIGDAIDSAIGQSYQNLEILIVNDGSPLPEAEAILSGQAGKDPRIRVLSKPNGGVGTARNFALDAATGDYVMFLDADNIADPCYARTGVDVLEQFPESAFMVGLVRFFIPATGETQGIYNPLPFDRSTALLINRFGDAGAFFRRSSFVDNNLRYSEVRTAYEDWGLWMDFDRLGLRGEVVPRVMYKYRIRQDSMMETHGRANHAASISWLLHHHMAELTGEEAKAALTTILQESKNHLISGLSDGSTLFLHQHDRHARREEVAPRAPLRHKVVDEMSRVSMKVPGLNKVLRVLMAAASGRRDPKRSD